MCWLQKKTQPLSRSTPTTIKYPHALIHKQRSTINPNTPSLPNPQTTINPNTPSFPAPYSVLLKVSNCYKVCKTEYSAFSLFPYHAELFHVLHASLKQGKDSNDLSNMSACFRPVMTGTCALAWKNQRSIWFFLEFLVTFFSMKKVTNRVLEPLKESPQIRLTRNRTVNNPPIKKDYSTQRPPPNQPQ